MPDIYDITPQYGGKVTFRFSQGSAAYKICDFYQAQQATEGGICCALCCHWMRERARGQSFWTGRNGLFAMNGNQIVAINATQAMSAVQAQTAFSVRLKSPRDHMIQCGFRPQADSEMVKVMETLGGDAGSAVSDKVIFGKTSGPELMLELEDILWDAAFATSPTFLMIRLKKGGDWTLPGHAICAFIQGPLLVFFDPNYGEFTFENVDVPTFSSWLIQFLVKTDYATRYPEFAIDPFDHVG